AFALEHVISAWTGPSRSLALLYQECQADDASHHAVRGEWVALWRDFWREIAELWGLDEDDARLMHAFAESEALYHLSKWSPTLEQAALRDLCHHIATIWLGAPAAPMIGAVLHAQIALRGQSRWSVPDVALGIARAAAAAVEEYGLAGL